MQYPALLGFGDLRGQFGGWSYHETVSLQRACQNVNVVEGTPNCGRGLMRRDRGRWNDLVRSPADVSLPLPEGGPEASELV